MSGIETDTYVSTDVLRPKASYKMETHTHISKDVLEKGGGGRVVAPTGCIVRKGGKLPMFVTPFTPLIPHVQEVPVNMNVGKENKAQEQWKEGFCE